MVDPARLHEDRPVGAELRVGTDGGNVELDGEGVRGHDSLGVADRRAWHAVREPHEHLVLSRRKTAEEIVEEVVHGRVEPQHERRDHGRMLNEDGGAHEQVPRREHPNPSITRAPYREGVGGVVRRRLGLVRIQDVADAAVDEGHATVPRADHEVVQHIAAVANVPGHVEVGGVERGVALNTLVDLRADLRWRRRALALGRR